MKVEVENRAGVSVVRPKGDLIGDAEGGFTGIVKDLLGLGNAKIIADLSDVAHINSSGLGDLVRLVAQTNSQGGRFLLAASQPFVLGVFQATKLDKFFDIFDSVDAAIEAM